MTDHDKLDKFMEGDTSINQSNFYFCATYIHNQPEKAYETLHVPVTIVVCSNDIPKGRNHGCKP